MRILMMLIIVAVLLGSAGAASAQDRSPDAEGRIAGHVVSAEGEEPLEGATVGARDPSDSTLVTGTVTDDTGAFVLDNLPFGEHVVRVSFVGFETVQIADVRVTRDEPERDLGTIRLTESTEQLDEVEVADERVATEMQIHRTVYNTADQPVTAGAGTNSSYMESSRNRNAQQVTVTFSYNFGQQSQHDRQRDDRGGEPEGDFEGEGYQQ